jgi:hypothetical protein
LAQNSKELHYVAHFQEPLELEAGDIGFITRNPDRFNKLDNAFDEIGDVFPPHPVQEIRFTPKNRWETSVVDGVVRYAQSS